MILMEFELAGFLGRFHPIIVHLPIGFLLLGGLLEYLSYRGKQDYSRTSSLVFLAGAIAALLAAGLGWLLASSGGYNENALDWHRWMGIAVAVLAVVVWLSKSRKLKLAPVANKFMLIALVIIIAITGHLGGNLTHGSNYLLEYAPEGISRLLGSTPTDRMALASDPDSVMVFTDLIQPILNDRCLKCHNGDKMKGELNLEDTAGIMAGGDDGAVIETGSAVESELFKRITLPQGHKKFMPGDGNEPLTYNQIKLIAWWIDSGGDFEGSVSAAGVPPDIKFVLAQNYGLDTDPKPYVEKASVEPAAVADLEQLQSAGFYAQPIAVNNNFVEVKKKKTTAIDKKDLALINNVKKQVTWLHLSEANLEDNDLAFLSGLENLTLLRLDNNAITNQGVKAIEGLPHLESLNLYGTEVTVEVLESLKTLPALKKVFLWQTNVSPEEVARIQDAIPGLEVDGGLSMNLP